MRHSQKGAALLILIAMIGAAFVAILLGTFGGADQNEARDRRTAEALAQAKEALIHYAASYADVHPGFVPGYLPCPDDGSVEGSAATGSANCTTRDLNALGRLPWKTLGVPDLRDGNGECLWYVASGNFKANLNKTELMNWDTNGLLTVLSTDGTAAATGNTPTGAVAIVFAPGPAIGAQSRTESTGAPICRGNFNAGSYLDTSAGTNNAAVSTLANRVDTYVSALRSTSFNDRLIYITSKDIFDAIERRKHVNPENPSARVSFADLMKIVTRRTAECIAYYPRQNAGWTYNYDRRMPWTTDHPLGSNNYGTNSNYDDRVDHYFGRTPFRTNTSKSTTVNSMVGDTLFSLSNCPPDWDEIAPWWQNWKDHLFYAVSRDFAPYGDSTYTNCGDCVSVNGWWRDYAGIVFFGGKRLAGQNRNNVLDAATSTDKGNVANYLEDANASVPGTWNGQIGRGNYKSGAETGTFNDVLYCIREDLSIDDYCDD